MKISKIIAGMSALAMAATMSIAASAADEFDAEMTNTAVTMDDNGIRINVFNPWGEDDTHAIPSTSVFENAVEFTVTVEVKDVDKVGAFDMWLAVSNFGDAETPETNFAYWGPGDAANTDSVKTDVVSVTEDGVYTIKVALDNPWVCGANDFAAIQTNMDRDAWKALKEEDGEQVGDPETMKITGFHIVTGDPASESSSSASGAESSSTDSSSSSNASSTTSSTSSAASSSSKSGSTGTTTTTTKTSTSTAAASSTASDNTNAGTGATAGIAFAGLALAGAALVVSKRK